MARITHFDVSDVWEPQATFTIGGTPTDPTAVTLLLQNAAGVESTVASSVSPAALTSASSPLAKMSTGVFKPNPGISLTAAGYWFAKFIGTGTAAGAETQQIIVDPDEFSSDGGLATHALVGLAETKDWLQQQNITTGEDLELVRTINDASARFAEEAEREFKPFSTNPSVRLFDVDELAYYCKVVTVGDLTSFTQLRLLDSLGNLYLDVTPLTNIISLPRNRRAWQPIRKLTFRPNVSAPPLGGVIEVTGTWGFPSVPGNVRQAVLDTVASVMDRDVEHYRQDLAPTPTAAEGGTTIVMAQTAQRVLTLPPSAWAVAQSYRDLDLG